MATLGCGVSNKDTKHTDKCSNNNKTNQCRNNTVKPQTNIFSKYCKDNKKDFDIKYTQITQGPYNKQQGRKTFSHYESFLNVRNSSTE
jgi:hypothetical protein